MPLVHIAGRQLQVNNRLRQRCSWCGTVLADYDLERVAVMVQPGEEPAPPAMWEEGALIAVDGGASWVEPPDGEKLPEGACALIDDDVTV